MHHYLVIIGTCILIARFLQGLKGKRKEFELSASCLHTLTMHQLSVTNTHMGSLSSSNANSARIIFQYLSLIKETQE